MKVLLDFFPVLLFFAVYQWQGIYAATAALMAVTLLQAIWHRVRHGRFETIHLVTLALVAVFGGATLALHDDTFIKWKPTVVNWLFAAAFLATQFIGNKPLIARMMDSKIALPAQVWTRLNAAWSLFFLGMGALNLWVAFRFPTETWVNFKLFGLLGLTFAFVLAQGFWLARHVQEEPAHR
ncbi:MAG: septation protein A [Mariprofundaceae bacterium]